MKKNLISVLILALVFANLVLTTLLIFTILPETKKANNLIDQVCQAISLDLKSGTATSASQIPQEQIADYALNADGENLTFSFAPSDDNSMHILVCGISLSLNKESDGYKQYKEDLSTKKNVILKEVTDVIGEYSMEQYNADKGAVHDKILKKLQKDFGADYIVDVNIVSSLTQ